MASRRKHPTPPKRKYLAVRATERIPFWIARRGPLPCRGNQIHVQWLELIDEDSYTYRELDWFTFVSKNAILDYDVPIVRKPGIDGHFILASWEAAELTDFCLSHPI